MSKFKIGDNVKIISTGLIGQTGMISSLEYRSRNWPIEVTITKSERGGGSKVPVAANEIELVPPVVPSFRKGDKVLVEYEVLADEPQRHPHADRHVKVTAPGVKAGDGVTRLADFLAAGTITRAPEPPYVPKPGDRFKFNTSDTRELLCIFVDDKSILYENTVSGLRYVCTPSLYNFKR